MFKGCPRFHVMWRRGFLFFTDCRNSRQFGHASQAPQRLLSYLLEIKPKRYTFVAYTKEYEKDHTTDTDAPVCADLDGAGWRHRDKG